MDYCETFFLCQQQIDWCRTLSQVNQKYLFQDLYEGSWVVRSIPYGGPFELFLVQASASTTGVTKAVVCIIMSVVGAYKITLAAIRKE